MQIIAGFIVVAIVFAATNWVSWLHGRSARHDQDIQNIWRAVLESERRTRALADAVGLVWVEEQTQAGHYRDAAIKASTQTGRVASLGAREVVP